MCDRMMSLDHFGDHYKMTISKDVHYLPSMMGVFMTFFLWLVVLGYTAQKIDILVN